MSVEIAGSGWAWSLVIIGSVRLNGSVRLGVLCTSHVTIRIPAVSLAFPTVLVKIVSRHWQENLVLLGMAIGTKRFVLCVAVCIMFNGSFVYTGDWTQTNLHAKQVLYQWAISSALYFTLRQGLVLYLPASSSWVSRITYYPVSSDYFESRSTSQ